MISVGSSSQFGLSPSTSFVEIEDDDIIANNKVVQFYSHIVTLYKHKVILYEEKIFIYF